MKRLISVFIASLTALSVFAQGADCRSQRSIADAQSQIDAELQSIGADPGKLMASLDSQLKAKAAALGWPKELQNELRTQALSSETYWAFEKEKQPYIAALTKAISSSSGPNPRTSKCEAAKQVKLLARQLAEVNRKQYEHAAREIGIKNSDTK